MSGRGPDGFPHLPLRPHNYVISHVPILWVCRLRPVCHGWCFLTTSVLSALQVQALGCPQYPVGTHCPPSDHAEGKLSLVIEKCHRHGGQCLARGWGQAGFKSCTLVWKQRAPRSRVTGPEGPQAIPLRPTEWRFCSRQNPTGSRPSSVGRGQGTGGTRGGSARGVGGGWE